jgi:ABC-type lipoprotein export system ATPase subunit
MQNFYKGSDWSKWDLHVHTPISIEQNYGGDTETVWNQFIQDLEALDPDCKVLGINDYYTIEGYKKLAELQRTKNILQGRVLFPVIELRISAFGNLHADDPWKRVNLHIIFNNDNIPLIESQFLNILPFEHQNFSRHGLKDDLLTELGQFIKNRQPPGKQEGTSVRKIGFRNLNYDHKQVYDCLRKSGLDYFTAIGKSEWDAMRWDGTAIEKMDVVDRCHFLFTAAYNVKSVENGKSKLEDQGILKPLLDCSDAHSFSNSLDSNRSPIKDRIGNSLTWIKADYTFEGLKQICFEPETRFSISQGKPNYPVRRINSIKLCFPEDTKISKKEGKNRGKESPFCLANNYDFSFSPYFTCLIGGRGTGKSTILNLIAYKLGGNSSFFESNILRSGTTTLDLNSCVRIDTSSTDIEFISQNQVENYADSPELTEAIYDRLVQSNDFEGFKTIEDNIMSYCQKVERQIEDINLRTRQRQDLIKLKEDLSDYKKIIASYDNPVYKTLTDEIKKISEDILEIQSSRAKWNKLLQILTTIQHDFVVDSLDNEYSEALSGVVSGLNNLLSGNKDFSLSDNKENELEKRLFEHKKALDVFLNSQGVSKDDILDYERAITQSSVLTSNIEILTKQGIETSQRINSFDSIHPNGKELKLEYEDKIVSALNPFNDRLISTDPNVLDISFQYEFNEESALNSLLDEFETHFKEYKPSEHATKVDSVRDYLLCVEPLKVDKHEDYMKALEQKGATPNSKQYIKNLLEKKDNFEIYKLLINKIYNNPVNHKKIIGFYGGKDLEECSFGQRCTAVIVALLMFGNKPLLIDEPEAHLDSRLVAEYLVKLIKDTKYRRQIIFATHNANFVINGDAELIHILEILDNNKTNITATSIEDLENREKLLSLEGGRTAFEIRDKKLIRS